MLYNNVNRVLSLKHFLIESINNKRFSYTIVLSTSKTYKFTTPSSGYPVCRTTTRFDHDRLTLLT